MKKGGAYAVGNDGCQDCLRFWIDVFFDFAGLLGGAGASGESAGVIGSSGRDDRPSFWEGRCPWRYGRDQARKTRRRQRIERSSEDFRNPNGGRAYKSRRQIEGSGGTRTHHATDGSRSQ